MNKKWMALGAAVVLAAAGAAFLIRGGGDGDTIDDKLIVKVGRKDLAIEVVDTGKVQARERVSIKSKVAGVVTEVLVDEGALVQKGQLLLKLDPVDFAREVARAEAEAAQAQSALELALSGLARRRHGLAEKVVAAVDVEVAESDVKMKEAQKKSAETLLGAARDRLASTQIKSPLGGTVIERGIQAGEVVTPGVQATFDGKALLVVADVSTLVVRSELNQIDVAKVVMGQPVTLTLDALPGRTFNARISKIAPAAVKASDRDTEVFPVEATVQDADPAIKAGMTADVRILVDTKKAVLALPIEAVTRKDARSSVKKLVRTGETRSTSEVEVHTGASNDREIEVTQGLSEGDEVVVDPPSSKDNEAKI